MEARRQNKSKFRGTVKKSGHFNPDKDAETLEKNLKTGDRMTAIIDIFASRTNAQRIEIAGCYQATYGTDLQHDIKKKTDGKFKTLLVALLKTPMEYEVQCLHDALSGRGVDEKAVVDILIHQNNAGIEQLKKIYSSTYKKQLEKDIEKNTSGNLQTLLLALAMGGRDETDENPENQAKDDATSLQKTETKMNGECESIYIDLFSKRGFTTLRAIFNEYEQLTGRDIMEGLKSELSGKIKEALMTITEYIRNPSAESAQRLYCSLKGMRTNDATLQRVIISRCEVDMEEIKSSFKEQYGRSLEHFISGNTSGPYKKLLLSLVKE